MSTMSLSGEKYSSKVGGFFASEAAADAAIEKLESAGFSNEQILLVRPDEKGPGKKVEPETKGIARTLVKAHLVFGTVGLLLGLLAASLLVFWSNWAIVTTSPILVHIALGFLGGVAGLLLGGMYGLRPDHDSLALNVKAAADSNDWSVVVQVQSHDEKSRASELLEQYTDVTHETL